MKKYFFLLSLATLLILSGCILSSLGPVQEPQLAYTYDKLKLFDLDQMSDVIQNKLKQYQKSKNDVLFFEAIQICFSRPNDDGMIKKIIENMQLDFKSNENWQPAFEAVAEQAFVALKSKTTAVVDQVTYLVWLENVIAEFRSEVISQYESPKFETLFVQKIANEDIVISKAARAESQLNLMRDQESPSVIAKALLSGK